MLGWASTGIRLITRATIATYRAGLSSSCSLGWAIETRYPRVGTGCRTTAPGCDAELLEDCGDCSVLLPEAQVAHGGFRKAFCSARWLGQAISKEDVVGVVEQRHQHLFQLQRRLIALLHEDD